MVTGRNYDLATLNMLLMKMKMMKHWIQEGKRRKTEGMMVRLRKNRKNK
jgi:hypothetical protein